MENPQKILLWLLGLSLVTTLLAKFGTGGISGIIWVNLAFLFLAGWKARLVLNGYLGLSTTRFWRRGFTGFVVIFLLLITALSLIGGV